MPCHQRIYSDTHSVLEHVHSPAKCYPTLASGVVLPAHANVNVLGAITEIVPASTITEDFDIHFIIVEASTTDGLHEIVLYYGAGDTECGRVRYGRGGSATQTAQLWLTTSGPDHTLIPANSRIRAQMAHSAAAGASAETVTVSIGYHQY